MLVIGARLQHRDNIGKQAFDPDVDFLEGEFPGFDLGDVEDGVDDVQQVAAGRFQFVEFVRLLAGDATAPDEVGHAGNCIERRTNLVAHVGQESAFRDVRSLGGRLGDTEFFGTPGDQFLKMLPVLFQFGFGTQAFGDVAGNDHQRLALALGRIQRHFAYFADARLAIIACQVFNRQRQFAALPGFLVATRRSGMESRKARAVAGQLFIGLPRPGVIFQLQYPFRGAVDALPAILAILDHHDIWQGVDETAQLLVALAQGGHRLAQRRDVAEGDDGTDHFPVLHHRRDREDHGQAAAILAPENVFAADPGAVRVSRT